MTSTVVKVQSEWIVWKRFYYFINFLLAGKQKKDKKHIIQHTESDFLSDLDVLLHLHCKSLVQRAGTLHSNDVLQKPTWLPTARQFPTWSPTENTMTSVELDWGLCSVGTTQGNKWDTYSIVAEPGDVTFIASVEQNRSSRLLPVFVSHKVSLFEGAIL